MFNCGRWWAWASAFRRWRTWIWTISQFANELQKISRSPQRFACLQQKRLRFLRRKTNANGRRFKAHRRIAINETGNRLGSSYLVTPISGSFSFVKSVGLLLFPLSLSRIRRLLLRRVAGFEETWVVGRRGNPKSGVGLVEDTNRVDENTVGVFESVNAGFQERGKILVQFRDLH